MKTVANNRSSFALTNELHRLWTDQAVWTRQFVLASLDTSNDAADVAARLVRNQHAIGRALARYYGRQSCGRLVELLKRQVMILADLLDAAKRVDRSQFAKLHGGWSHNAMEIAVGLSSINPIWERDVLAGRLQMHVSLVTAQISARLEENFGADIEAFDQDLSTVLAIADMVADGIVRDFADDFAA